MSLTTGPGPAPASPSPPAPAPGPDPASVSDFCRIAIAGPRSRADLAVPLGVPLVRLMPALLQHAGEEIGPDGGVRHGGWVLRRADGTRLEAARTLGAQQVREGDLLFLAHGAEDATPPLYDDVVEVITDRGVHTPWPSAGARRTAAAFGTVAVLVACGALAAAPGVLPGILGLAAAVFALGLGALVSRAFADVAAGTHTAVLAAPLGATGAAQLLGGGFGAAHLLLACAVIAVVGAVGPVLVGGGGGTFAALVVAGVLTCSGAVVAAVWGTDPTRAAAVAAPLALAATTVWPALALRVAHLPGPQLAATTEELEQLPELIGHDLLRARVDRARTLLTGMLTGSLLVVVGGILFLLASGRLWPSVLAASLGVLTLLRARLFREAAQVTAVLVTSLIAALGGAVLLVLDIAGQPVPLLGIVLPVSLVVALIACAVGILSGRRGINPRLARTLDIVETMLLLTVVPLVLAVWEVYTTLLKLKA